ncbi:LysR family transcriptional regulator [Pseudonocardia zijingensis]|uniref:LysR substrate-binding domain-containing protein n=1 Tax=Pseudonocardia zijingensis TaxID=153376 RepID=A0ABN1PLA3_9PSEU
MRGDMRLEWLVSFLAVVDTGSFVGAAEATHRSQPRISMHVAALERGVGIPLFNRRKRPVELTEAGKALADHARSILREIEATEVAMAAWRGGARGVVTLGCHPSASAAFVPHVLREAGRTSPDVRVVLVERSTLELDEALASGELDLCIRPASPPPTRTTVRRHLLWGETLVALHPPGHALAELPEPLPVAEVAAHPLLSIGRLDAPETGEFESYQRFRECGYELEPVQATNQPQTLMALVRHGFGVGVTNALAARVADTTGVCVRTLEGGAARHVAVHWDSARLLTAAARTLLQQIVQQPRPDGTEPVADPGCE